MFKIFIFFFLLASEAVAQPPTAPPPTPGGFIFQTLMYLMMAMIGFHFIVQRPEQKKEIEQEKFLSDLKKGELVATDGGLLGTVSTISEKEVSIEVAANVKVRVLSKNVHRPPEGTSSSVKKTSAAKKPGAKK